MMSELKTELLHKIMFLGADTYDKTHQDRYEAQIKADKLLEDYITERSKANIVNTSASGLHLQRVSERYLHINDAAVLIKSMPTDQSIQKMKAALSGQPETTVIDGELLVSYHNAR